MAISAVSLGRWLSMDALSMQQGRANPTSLLDVARFFSQCGIRGTLLDFQASASGNEHLPGLTEQAAFGDVDGNTINGTYVFLELYDTPANAQKALEFYRSRASWGRDAGLPTPKLIVNGRCLLKTTGIPEQGDLAANVFTRLGSTP